MIFWRSSFNGGDSQTFTVYAVFAQQQASRSELIDDTGENKVHATEIWNLQPSTEYIFYVVAKNKHGSSSSEIISCKTLGGKYFGQKCYNLVFSAIHLTDKVYSFITNGMVCQQEMCDLKHFQNYQVKL